MSSILGLQFARTVRSIESSPLRANSAKRLNIQCGPDSRLVFLTDPTGVAVERYKILRRRLCTSHPQGGVVLMTSPGPGEGKTLTSVNLAWSFAEAGHNCCLVDLDFRAPGVSRALAHEFEEGGVEEVLSGRRTVEESLRYLSQPPLHVLGIKDRVSSPGSLLSSTSLATLMTDLRRLFQWVIVDFAPAIPMADVAEVLPLVDGTIMVARMEKTSKDLIKPTLEILGPKLWGVVANDCVVNGSSYYGHYGKRK